MGNTPTTQEVKESFIRQQYDTNGRFNSAEEAEQYFDDWYYNELNKAKHQILQSITDHIEGVVEAHPQRRFTEHDLNRAGVNRFLRDYATFIPEVK